MAKTWRTPALAVFFLLLTLLMGAFDFPAFWNRGVSSASSATGADFGFAKVSETPFRLGLDLQGGAHLVYEADMSQIDPAERDEALQGVRDVIERRVNAFGVSEPVVQTTSSGGTSRVIVELAGVLDVRQAINEIGETPVLEFKEVNAEVGREATPEEQKTLDERNAAARTKAEEALARAKRGEDFSTLIAEYGGEDLPAATASNPAYAEIIQAVSDQALQSGAVLPNILETREGFEVVRLLGAAEAKRMELSHILVCFEGKALCQNPIPPIEANIILTNLKSELTAENFAEKAKEVSTDYSTAAEGGYLGWVEPGATVPAFELAARTTPVGQVSDVVETEYGYHMILKQAEEVVPAFHVQRVVIPSVSLNDIAAPEDAWKNTGLSGKQLTRATVQFDQQTSSPFVSLQFDGEGGDLFAELTKRNVGQAIAIFLDGEPISIPVVNEPIYGGQAVITGGFTVEEAKLLAQRLNAGALPVPVHLVSQQTVGPALGAVSLQKSLFAGLLGFALVTLYMIFMYRLPGLVAVLALLLYTGLNLAFYKLFGVTITLAGVAGFILSLGMAVDANVLVFERMKEEIRAGRDLRGALDEAFKRAWSAIRDGNFTTLIAAGVLYAFSSSFIKGFALTLTIGVLLSMFTALAVTHAYLNTAIRARFLRAPPLYLSQRAKRKAS